MVVVKEKGIQHVDGITASDIRSALYTHHSKDVFIEECKNGPTWSSNGLTKT